MSANNAATAKKMSTVALAALFLTNFAYMSDLVVIPTADVIYGYFLPLGVSVSVCDFILSGSQFFAIAGALASALIMRYFSKRTIILTLYTVFAVVTISTIAYVEPVWIAATRAISGLCFGAMFPTGIALIMEMYRDDEERCGKYIGFSNGTMGLVGGCSSIISGFLLGIGLAGGEIMGLRCSFALYLISIPILIALFVSLPKTPAEKDIDFNEVEDAAAGGKASWTKAAALVVSVAAANIIYCVMTYQYAMYLPQHFELSTTVTAFLGAMGGLMSCVAGFTFGKIFDKLGRFTITASFFGFIIAFLLFGFCADSLPLVFVGLVLNGLSFGYSVPYFYSYAASQFPARFQSTISSLLTVGMGVGMALCTFATTFFTGLLGLVSFDEVAQMDVINYAGFMPYVAGAAAVAFLLSLVLAIKDKKAAGKAEE